MGACASAIFAFSTGNTLDNFGNFGPKKKIQFRLIFGSTATLFEQIWSKNTNYQFNLRFVTQTNSNMQNSMVVFIFCILDGKHPFGQIGPKNQNCQFKLKFSTQTNSNMQNSMAPFTFSVLYKKHPFCTIFAKKIKIVSLS